MRRFFFPAQLLRLRIRAGADRIEHWKCLKVRLSQIPINLDLFCEGFMGNFLNFSILNNLCKCLAPSISAAWLRDSEGIARSRTRTYQQGNWCCSSRRSRSKSFSIHEFINVNFFPATCSRYIFEPGSNMPLGLASLRHKIYVRTS